ncbi:MAG: hypothetical protein LIR35_08990 [Bacteroidota bacterium]|nr:hypothetical protein [Bacteroidota bacterium]
MKKVFLLVTLLFICSSFSAWAQYPFKWSVGGAMGFGGGSPSFTMGMNIGFDKVIKETRWRWGIDAGIMNQGIADYFFEDEEPDRFVRPNYEYIGGFVDYSVFSKNGWTIFARGGLAPAHRRDLYIWHSEDKFTSLGVIGVGSDYYNGRYTVTGYIDPRGSFICMVSFGLWFGKSMKAK